MMEMLEVLRIGWLSLGYTRRSCRYKLPLHSLDQVGGGDGVVELQGTVVVSCVRTMTSVMVEDAEVPARSRNDNIDSRSSCTFPP